MKRLFTFLLFVSFASVAFGQISFTLNESAGTYPSQGDGIGTYQGNYYNNLMEANLLQQSNPSFGNSQTQMVEAVNTGSSTTFSNMTQYDGMPANYAAGWTYVVMTGPAAGRTGTIASNTACTGYPACDGTSGPVFTMADSGTAPSNQNIIYIYSPASGFPGSVTKNSLGWIPSGSGTYSVTLDTNPSDQPPALYGLPQPTQCLKLTNVASTDGASITTYLDTVSGQLNYAFNGSYTQGIQAKILSGSSLSLNITAQRDSNPVTTFINQTVPLSGTNWATYSATGSGAETTTTSPVAEQSSYSLVGTGSVCIVGAFLNEGTHTNSSPMRDSVINQIKAMNPGELRYNLLPGGSTLANLLQPQAYRQPAFATQTGGYYGGQNPGTPMSPQEFFQMAVAAGITSVSYSIPTTWTATELSNWADYLGGGAGTTYGAIRIALGQTTPWNQVFSKIITEYGNESWNAATPGVYYPYGYPYYTYLPLTIAACQSLKASASWNTAVDKCSMDVMQVQGSGNSAAILAADTNHYIDMMDGSDYYVETAATSAQCTQPLLDSESWVEAWANANDTSMGLNQSGNSSIPTSVYEAQGNLTTGTCTSSQLAGFPEGEGFALTNVLSPAYLQRAFPGKFVDYNFWELNDISTNFSSNASSTPATQTALWGIYNGIGGAYTNARPSVYALAAYNACANLGTGYSITGTNVPTYSPAASNGIPAETNVPLIHSFAFKKGTLRCQVMVNTDTVSHVFTISGTNAPVGTVTQTLFSSANLTDNNEAINVAPTVTNVVTSSTNPSSFTIPAHSMATYNYSVLPSSHNSSGMFLVGTE